MRIRLFVICLFLLLTAVPMLTHGAGKGEWIIKYGVKDLKTGQVVLERDFQTDTITKNVPIFTGAEYNITITINIAITVPYAVLKITTNLEHATILDRYWELHSKDYPVVDYNPNKSYMGFNQVKGNLVISLYGKIPTGITEQKINGIVLHKLAKYVIIELKGPNGEVLDHIIFDVIDAKIDEYQNLLKQKEDNLQTFRKTGVTPGYIKLFESVINQAKTVAEQGFVDKAIDLLNLLTVDGTPKEPVPSITETLFLPTTGVLLAVVVVVGFISLRTRGKLNYILRVIEDQIKDLEGLTLRASKVDKALSSSLESIKDRLKSLVGV